MPDSVVRKPWWQHAWAVFGAAIGIIGAVTGIISILPLVFRDATDAESLTVTAESADADLAPVFAVPVLADWSTFPASAGACSTEQLAWLERRGTPLTERFLISVANSASEGATLSLKDFRGEGTSAAGPANAVSVMCDQAGTGGSALRAARVDPASGRTAVYVQADSSLPDNPLVFNLAPGESGQFALTIQSSADFEGEIIFTSSVGPNSRTETVPIDGGLSAPGVAPQRLIVTQGGLACLPASESCSATAVLAELFAAAGGA